MNKEELVAKAKELSELEDLTGKGGEIEFLRREFKRTFGRDDDETLHDKELENQFETYFAKLAGEASALNANAADAKKALIEKAKTLLDSKNFKKATEDMNNLFEDFKHAGRCAKELDDQLWAEFKEIKDKFYENKNAYFKDLKEKIAASAAKKQEIVAAAKEALNIENIKEAGNKFNELMEEWKKAGYAGKEQDDQLWAEFSSTRKSFNEKRNEYFNGMKKVFEERAAKKEDIISRAKILIANSTFSKEEIESMKALRAEWKGVGFAGKDKDDALWKEFNTTANKYFDLMRQN